MVQASGLLARGNAGNAIASVVTVRLATHVFNALLNVDWNKGVELAESPGNGHLSGIQITWVACESDTGVRVTA